ncbi:alpha/beta hydrolase [Herbiconiux sp. CPCC 203407]|uniref:Alpha/beta hydrolase n=1 Tax=Herbiconiux oxytropis TaxID=2970915 RepID=A0AA41XI24_9MICO|nr:alpha/beta hydrolase [Herbiconiux oxytropis]MCS5721609.1 alpha/beta hydrolase [Herbiconiux oxytropis]MCS5726764.1 alpha/beta hydrolase [Herbiconiux oxytropis]
MTGGAAGTVLLLHGLGGSREDALSMFSPIVPTGTHLVAPDARAHGADVEPSSPSELTLEAMAERIAREVLASQEAAGCAGAPVTVIGISMGAALALRLALTEALPLSHAVFVRPAFTDESLPSNLRAFPVIGELLADLGAQEGERAFLDTDLYGSVRAESRLGAAGLLEQFRSPFAVERAARLIEIPRSRAFTSADDIGALDLPTAIVWAPRDPVHPVPVAELWMDELDGAVSVPLPARDDDYSAYVAATRGGVAEWLGWS